jgi:exosortase A-associated hydrolase 1
VGAHRQFVALARALAEAGTPVFRFDYRGMGDSEGELRSFEDASADIAAAIDAFQRAVPAVHRVVLWGLCDGASAALLYLQTHRDPRVAGLALLNPWVRSQASLAKTHVKHYYRQRLKEREFWMKLLSGRVALGALSGFANNLRQAFGAGTSVGSGGAAGPSSGPYQDRMAQAWAAFPGPVLLMLSEHDYTAREFAEYTAGNTLWQQALKARPASRVDIAGADHTCSNPQAQRAVETATAGWLERTFLAARARS